MRLFGSSMNAEISHFACFRSIPRYGPTGSSLFRKKASDAFSKTEIDLMSLIADNVALAFDDWLNFAIAEAVTAQLESERTKLKLILDLNNSVVSNLELREVLRSVSPSIRKTMRLDGVALILPDEAKKHLQLYALDFPNRKGILHQDMSKPLDDSVAGESLSCRKTMGW